MSQRNFETTLPPAPKGMDKAEWQTRLDLAACYRMVDHFGWTSIVYNHITCRIPGTEHLLINPFGIRYDEIRATDLIKIDIDGNKLSDSDWPVNLAGYLIHSQFIKRDLMIYIVLFIHIKRSHNQSVRQTNRSCLTQEGCQFHERVGYHDFEGIVLNDSEQSRITTALGDKNHTLVLKNHGLITAGETCTWAFVRHHAFIKNTEVQLRAMATGSVRPIDEAVMIHTRDQFEGGSAQAGAKVRHPEWPAMIRLIDQKDPSWKF